MAPVGWDTYFERLGPLGLRLVLSGLLAPDDAASLTGADMGRLDAPGRAQAVADLLADEPALAAPLLELLDRRAGAEGGDPSSWDEKDVRGRLSRMLRSPDPSAARILHRLARVSRPPLPIPELRAAAEVIAPELLAEQTGTRPKYLAKVASDRAGIRELQQQRRELEGRLRQLEGQLARALERAAQLEESLAKRLDELRRLRAEDKQSRDERQRLDKELQRLRRRIDDLNERRAKERTGEVTTALRRLTTEQRRTHSALDKMRDRAREQAEMLRTQNRELSRLDELIEKMLALQEAQFRTSAAAQEAILQELGAVRSSVDEGPAEAGGEPGGSKPKEALASTPRVGIFVDVQNMFYGAREKGARLDFEALLDAASSGRQLVRAVAYLVEAPETDQRAFIHLLQMKAYEVKRKPLRIRPDRTMKGNWDLEMALDALGTAEHLDVVVLVTGDGDFVPLVRSLKLRGLRVEVYGFTRSSAPDLREAADRFFPITRRLLRPLDSSRRSARRPAPRARKPASKDDRQGTEGVRSGS
jgi:uncharacterized LabA/DUF88 family protein